MYDHERPVKPEDLKTGLMVWSVHSAERMMVIRTVADQSAQLRTARGLRLTIPIAGIAGNFFHVLEPAPSVIEELRATALNLINQGYAMLEQLDLLETER